MVVFSKPSVVPDDQSETAISESKYSSVFKNMFARVGGGDFSHAALDNPYNVGEFMVTFNAHLGIIHHDTIKMTSNTPSSTIHIVAHGTPTFSDSSISFELSYADAGFTVLTGATVGSTFTIDAPMSS